MSYFAMVPMAWCAASIASSSMAMNITEEFGKLAHDKEVMVQPGGKRLVGAQPSAIYSLSGAVVGLATIDLASRVHQSWTNQTVTNPSSGMWNRALSYFHLFALAVAVASVAVNFYMLEDFTEHSKDMIEYPTGVKKGSKDYQTGAKLRGTLGNGAVIVNGATVGVSFLTLVGLMVRHFYPSLGDGNRVSPRRSKSPSKSPSRKSPSKSPSRRSPSRKSSDAYAPLPTYYGSDVTAL